MNDLQNRWRKALAVTSVSRRRRNIFVCRFLYYLSFSVPNVDFITLVLSDQISVLFRGLRLWIAHVTLHFPNSLASTCIFVSFVFWGHNIYNKFLAPGDWIESSPFSKLGGLHQSWILNPIADSFSGSKPNIFRVLFKRWTLWTFINASFKGVPRNSRDFLNLFRSYEFPYSFRIILVLVLYSINKIYKRPFWLNGTDFSRYFCTHFVQSATKNRLAVKLWNYRSTNNGRNTFRITIAEGREIATEKTK